MIVLRRGVALVDVERSGVVETVHSGHMVIVDAAGSTIATLGEPDQAMFPRSSNKPLQAVGMRRLGLDVPPEQLALATASHSGEPSHLAVVRAMLDAGGLAEDDLRCPPGWPLGEAAREAWIAAGGRQQRICMNCSGKHAAMLLTCRHNGWPLDGYLDPDHPLQQGMRATVEDLAGEPVAAVGVDGCGAPVFALTLVGVVRAFRRIATAERDVADAMRARPDLVAGTGRAATLLMAGVPGLIAKDGAEGVFAAALPDGSAVAVKIDDGAPRAAERSVVAGLWRLGVRAAVLDELAVAPVLGGGAPVGEVRFRGGLL